MSIGHISKSRAWISLEKKYKPGIWVSFGRTYVGTTAGVVMGLGAAVLIAHFRPSPKG